MLKQRPQTNLGMKQYKILITISIFFWLNINANGQVIANAGPDLRLCINQTNPDTVFLGGNPSAIGGIAPYKYIWFTSIPGSNNHLSASYYLTDTTVANPKLKHLSSVKLNLMVIDGKGDFSYDEVNVVVSSNTMTADQKVRYITQGQSVSLYTLYNGGFAPYQYAWYPNYKISDTSSANPVVTPDTSITYFLKIVDAEGCIGPKDNFTVYVYPTGIQAMGVENTAFDIFPNPVVDVSIIRFNYSRSKSVKFLITDLTGREIKTIEPMEFGEFKINKNDLDAGVYVLQVFEDMKFVGRRNFVVR